jgi:hypothetical protein
MFVGLLNGHRCLSKSWTAFYVEDDGVKGRGSRLFVLRPGMAMASFAREPTRYNAEVPRSGVPMFLDNGAKGSPK